MPGASYDPRTDKIEGAVPGTLTYYHELCHQEWEHNGKAAKYENTVASAAILALFSVCWQLWLPAEVFSLIMMLYYFIPEVHAWLYAIEKIKKQRDAKHLKEAEEHGGKMKTKMTEEEWRKHFDAKNSEKK